MVQDEESPQTATMVEEVPSHEIYASLLGIQRKPSCSNHPSTAPSLDTTVIPTDNEVAGNSAFGQAYRHAQDTKALSSLAIQPSNKGFQLLTKMGWNESDGGLGRNRQGSLVPVKTMLKQDKKGLGAVRKKAARITHPTQKVLPKKKPQQQRETKARRKRRLRAEREKQQQGAKNIRLMLRTDVGDEYETLYRQLH